MPDTLVNLTSPAEPTSKARCRKKAPKPGRQAAPSATIAALASAEAARVLPSMIFHEADQIEIGTRRAGIAFDLVWPIIDDIPGSRLDQLEGHTDQLYLLLNIVSNELDAARGHADKIAEAARELKHPTQAQPLGTGDDVLSLRLKLKAAEDALNATDNDEPPLIEAYHQANDRFLDAPARTPADVLLKLERLADLGDMASDPGVSTNRIVLNLIRDLRAGLGINGQVQ